MWGLFLLIIYLLIGIIIAKNVIENLKIDLGKRVTESEDPEKLLELQYTYRQLTSFIREEALNNIIILAITIFWLPLILIKIIKKISNKI